MMELDNRDLHSDKKQSLQHSTASLKKDKKSSETDDHTEPSKFVNHAAMLWHESRRKWIGNQSHRQRAEKDPIISWSMGYEDILLTNDPFHDPIPLPEMVDFLADIWQDDGLFDS